MKQNNYTPLMRLLSLLLILFMTETVNADTPAQLITKARNKISDAPSLTVQFTFSGSDISGDGTLILADDCFKMQVGGMRYWYDGTTLWSYFASTDEVYISTPTPAELAEINPVSVLNNISSGCSFTTIKSATSTHKIKCTPKSTSVPFTTMTLTLNSSTLYPTSIDVTPRQSSPLSLTVTSIAEGKKLAASTFKFKKSDAPGAEVVDMR